MEEVKINRDTYDKLLLKSLRYDALEKSKIRVYKYFNMADSKSCRDNDTGEFYILGMSESDYKKFLKEVENPNLQELALQYRNKYIKIAEFFDNFEFWFKKLPKWLKKWYIPDISKQLEEMNKDLRTWN